jgi:hypothetical protein
MALVRHCYRSQERQQAAEAQAADSLVAWRIRTNRLDFLGMYGFYCHHGVPYDLAGLINRYFFFFPSSASTDR